MEFLVIIVVVIICVIIQYNICVKLRNKVKQSKSSIDVYLNERFDLIPNLVECVKGYKIHEEKILTELAKRRSMYIDNPNLKDAASLNSKMITFVGNIEEYPDIKASEQFLKLQQSLIRIENQLQAARRIYNGDVTLYNTRISSFPTNIIATFFGFGLEELFEIEEYKKNIKVDF